LVALLHCLFKLRKVLQNGRIFRQASVKTKREHDDIQPRSLYPPPLRIPPVQKRFNHLDRFRVFDNQPRPRLAVNHKGFVQAGNDAAIKPALDIVAQWRARFADARQKLACGGLRASLRRMASTMVG